MKCAFCGHQFKEEDVKDSCQGCPLAATCRMIKCPNCNYEMPKEPGLIKALKSRRRRNDRTD